MDRVMVTIPDNLKRQLDQAAKTLTENRSQFVRRAVEERIERLRQLEFEKLLAQAYRSADEDPAADVRPWLGIQEAAADEAWCWDD